MKQKDVLTHTSVEEAFRTIMLNELKVVKKWRKTASQGKDPEGVHQVRIALRKMRTALVIFRPLTEEGYDKKLAKRLKQYSRVLDSARDLDVFIDNHLNSSPPVALSTAIMAEHRQAYKKVAKLLKSHKFNKRLREDKKWLNSNKVLQKLFKNEGHVISLGLFAKNTLSSLHLSIVTQAPNIDKLDDESLHRLRIDCKKLRYATEFFSSLYDKKTIINFLEQLKILLDSLGEIHDAYIQNKQIGMLLDKQLIEDLDAKSFSVVILELGKTKKAHVMSELVKFADIICPWTTPS